MSDESKIDDGGPAFPRTANETDLRAYLFSEVGMSLRDWFAGMAMQGLLVNVSDADVKTAGGPACFAEIVAKGSFFYADAMLAERKRGKP